MFYFSLYVCFSVVLFSVFVVVFSVCCFCFKQHKYYCNACYLLVTINITLIITIPDLPKDQSNPACFLNPATATLRPERWDPAMRQRGVRPQEKQT